MTTDQRKYMKPVLSVERFSLYELSLTPETYTQLVLKNNYLFCGYTELFWLNQRSVKTGKEASYLNISSIVTEL